MCKYIPTDEELNKILGMYKLYGNYALISREMGISPAIIKRIISEHSIDNIKTTNNYLTFKGSFIQQQWKGKSFYDEVNNLYEKVLNGINLS